MKQKQKLDELKVTSFVTHEQSVKGGTGFTWTQPVPSIDIPCPVSNTC